MFYIFPCFKLNEQRVWTVPETFTHQFFRALTVCFLCVHLRSPLLKFELTVHKALIVRSQSVNHALIVPTVSLISFISASLSPRATC